MTVPDLPHNLAAVASRSEVGGKVATFFGGLTGSESGGQRKKSRADVLVNDDSFGDTAEATVVRCCLAFFVLTRGCRPSLRPPRQRVKPTR